MSFAKRKLLGGLFGGLGFNSLSLDNGLFNLFDGLHADHQLKVNMNVAIDVESNGVLTSGLDGLTDIETLAVDFDASLSQNRISDHRSGDGTEQHALFADLGVDENLFALERSLQGLSVGDTLLLALGNVATALLELLEVARGGRLGDLVAEEVVLRIALGHVDDVALSALAPELTQEDLPRVFQRFYRVDKARSRESGGTGLGLSIAKEIVDRHEGTIELLDRPGPGLTVRIVLLVEGPRHGRE